MEFQHFNDWREHLQARAEAIDALYERLRTDDLPERLDRASDEVWRFVRTANAHTIELAERWDIEMVEIETVQDLRRARHELQSASPRPRPDRSPREIKRDSRKIGGTHE